MATAQQDPRLPPDLEPERKPVNLGPLKKLPMLIIGIALIVVAIMWIRSSGDTKPPKDNKGAPARTAPR